MARYPTEMKHGESGYRDRKGLSDAWATDPGEPLSPRERYMTDSERLIYRNPALFPGFDPFRHIIEQPLDAISAFSPGHIVETKPLPVKPIGPAGPIADPVPPAWFRWFRRNPYVLPWWIGLGVGSTLIWTRPGNPDPGGQQWQNPYWTYGGSCEGFYEAPDIWVDNVSGSARTIFDTGPGTYGGGVFSLEYLGLTCDDWFFTGPEITFPPLPGREIIARTRAGENRGLETYILNEGVDPGTDTAGYWTPFGAPGYGYGEALPFPNNMPDLAPIMWPGVPVPQPFSQAVGDPVTQPSENPLTRPDLAQPGRVTTVPLTGLPGVVLVPPTVRPSPGTDPVPTPVPDVTVQPSPGGGLGPPVITSPSNPTRRHPPGPGKKERKVHMGRLGKGGFMGVINVFTESLDFVDSLYNAIKPLLKPNEKCANHNYACKLGAIWDHFDDEGFDAALFVESWVNNQFEDMLFGKLGQATGKASAGIGVTTGISRGVNSSSDALSEFLKKNKLDGLQTPIPQLDYDPETGSWAITWLGFSTPKVGG